MTGHLHRLARAALIASSSACHAAGRWLNRLQWRLDGIDR